MRGHSFEGVILKRTNIRDSDKLLTLFTRQYGKITLLAKGLRKSSSRRVGVLELFNRIQAFAVPGKNQLDIITEVILIDGYPHWRHQLGRITLAYQLCETIDKLTADHQPHPRLYATLTKYMRSISQLNSDWQRQTNTWLLDVIQELGFWPEGKVFTGSIVDYIEDISNNNLYSPRLLARLKHPTA